MLSLITVVLSVLKALLQYANNKALMDSGAKQQVSQSLLETAELVADGKQIAEWVSSQPDSVLADIMQRYYTRKSDIGSGSARIGPVPHPDA